MVDEEDFESMSKFKWCAFVAKRNSSGYEFIYAVTNQPDVFGKRRVMYMHRHIMNAPWGIYVDHINGDGLDNRRSNLRLASNMENQRSSRPRSGGTSMFKGVCWNKACNAWQAQIRIDKKRCYLGIFKTEEDAAMAYDVAAAKHFGEFALKNVYPGG